MSPRQSVIKEILDQVVSFLALIKETALVGVLSLCHSGADSVG